MTYSEREKALESVIRGLQQDAKSTVEMWRDVGNAIMLFTDNQRILVDSLSKIFQRLDGSEVQPLQSQEVRPEAPAPQPYPAMPYPAYQEPPRYPQPSQPTPNGYSAYPASSQQPPWPPYPSQASSMPPVTRTVPRSAPAAPSHQAQTSNQKPEWSLREALQNIAMRP